jgi:hypothetical protein
LGGSHVHQSHEVLENSPGFTAAREIDKTNANGHAHLLPPPLYSATPAIGRVELRRSKTKHPISPRFYYEQREHDAQALVKSKRSFLFPFSKKRLGGEYGLETLTTSWLTT